MFVKVTAFFKSLFAHNKKTVASALAPLTKIQADLKEVHTTAMADLAATHATIDKAYDAVDAHLDTMATAGAHLTNLSAILAPASAQAQAVANVTGLPVAVVTPAAVVSATPVPNSPPSPNTTSARSV